jgi:hypothetical protein
MSHLYDKQTRLANDIKEGTKKQNKKYEQERIALPNLLGKSDKDYDFEGALHKLATNTKENQTNELRQKMTKQQYERMGRHCQTVGNTDSDMCMPQHVRNRLTYCTSAYQYRNSHNWAGGDDFVNRACAPIRNSKHFDSIDPSKRQQETAPSYPIHPMIYGNSSTSIPSAKPAFVSDPSGCRTSSGARTYCNPETKPKDSRFNAKVEDYHTDNPRVNVA